MVIVSYIGIVMKNFLFCVSFFVIFFFVLVGVVNVMFVSFIDMYSLVILVFFLLVNFLYSFI